MATVLQLNRWTMPSVLGHRGLVHEPRGTAQDPQLEVVLGDRGRDQGVRGRHLQLQDHPRDLPDLRQGAKAQGCVCIMNEKYLFLMWGESNKNRS
jgi:hypothetical protein